ncbi:hypothetical protein I3842_15G060700 [Carya illinoinensis]|uniref:Reverse transcriptase zinc-binding domain-containing protein n=1 Tax=Carya illinoinensis TaxID=32201 RepID=A0A922A4M7_CARIL|nr:hypothetical protein I3842_15G060700 [Carya illinoinensis]
MCQIPLFGSIKKVEYIVLRVHILFFTNLEQNRQKTESSRAIDQKLIWKNLWKLHIPHRVKVFAWKVCKNILPTLRNLKSRKIIEDANCLWCQEEEEDVNHALVYCPLILNSGLQRFPSLKESTHKVDFLQLFLSIIRRKAEGELEKLFMMAWGFWYRRNQWMYEEQALTLDQVLEHALSLYQEHRAAAEALQIGLRYRCSWPPPPSSVLKLNVDEAIFNDQCRSGIGVVLRDDKDKYCLLQANPKMHL